MKTLILWVLLLTNNSVRNAGVRRHTHKSMSPVSILRVDPSQSQVSWKAEKLTGTHTGTIKIFLGQLTVQRGRLLGGYIMLDMNTITVSDLTESGKQRLENNLKSKNFFDVGRYTVARFDISTVAYASAPHTSLVTIAGNLFMHGITKKIAFKAKILRCDDAFTVARADVSINRRDWDIATKDFKYDSFIKPAITFHIILKATKR
jgi:polyisoprenoid-binding protein YceI